MSRRPGGWDEPAPAGAGGWDEPAPAGAGVELAGALESARAGGRKLLVTYVTGGLVPDWTDVLGAMVAGGADAVEIGMPFSDPVVDGPTIQEAARA
ncbi:MAG: tryptophan synthase subunit alpha, partial [Acidimicrobiales bacterium]